MYDIDFFNLQKLPISRIFSGAKGPRNRQELRSFTTDLRNVTLKRTPKCPAGLCLWPAGKVGSYYTGVVVLKHVRFRDMLRIYNSVSTFFGAIRQF